MADKIIRTFKYRIYPSKAQKLRLNETLAICCELYNAALQERRDAWRINHKILNYHTQRAQLPDIKIIRSDVGGVYAQTLQDVLRRVDKSFQHFFQSMQLGKKHGRPRFRPLTRYNSFSYPQYPQHGFKIQDTVLLITNIGKVKIKLHRPIEGKIKTLMIKREAGKWYASFCVEPVVRPLPLSDISVGIDVGLSAFATLSDGTEVENPRYYRAAQSQLRRAQRKVSRRKKGIEP